MPYHAGLMCDVLNLSYDFNARRGTVHFAPVNVCDMAGCVKLFTAIDENAEDIQTFSGDEPDTRYVKHGGEWTAILP